jgi:hypothetical protein
MEATIQTKPININLKVINLDETIQIHDHELKVSTIGVIKTPMHILQQVL